MRFGRNIILICAVLVVCVTCSACGASAMSSGSCREEVQGVAGVIRPETSSLSCAQIKELIEVRPSEPGGFVAIGEEPHRLWKCQVYVPKKSRVLLSCTHHQENFGIVKNAG